MRFADRARPKQNYTNDVGPLILSKTQNRRPGESRGPGFKPDFKSMLTTWIPAFAGMTALGFAAFLTFPHPLSADDASDAIRRELPHLRLTEQDLKLPSGGDLPLTVGPVERFFAQPLTLPATASIWADTVEKSTGTTPLLQLGYDILIGTPAVAVSSVAPAAPLYLPDDLSLELRDIVWRLAVAFEEAQPLLNQAVDSVTKTGRDGIKALHDWPQEGTGAIKQEISTRRIKAQHNGMKDFDDHALLSAAEIISGAVDAVQPRLAAVPEAQEGSGFQRIVLNTPGGKILLAGPDDDVYTEDDLRNIVGLIDLGGKNTYQSPVAAAMEKEIRVVIDLGSDVTVEADPRQRPTCGCGVFGIGLMYLPNSDGVKNLDASSYAQGLGLGGVGGLFIDGEVHLKADRYAQGAAACGVGILKVKNGDGSTFLVNRNGQGAAMVRGVGVFSLQGDNADIKGGLIEPDPREPKGAVSICQGVGFAERAYSGGGVGICSIQGSSNTVTGSYFSQGVGYWHALGIFRLRGDGNKTQARRYDLGSGVHYALGFFNLIGNKNRVINWGVGPNYAWDHSLAASFIEGDENEIQTEWGMGTAQIGGISIGRIRGNRNRLQIPSFGSGFFARNDISSSIQILEGSDNKWVYPDLKGSPPIRIGEKALFNKPDPWGVRRVSGVTLDPDLKLEPPQWPTLPQEQARSREMVDLKERIKSAEQKPAEESVADLVDVAAAFSLDKDSPRRALRKLVSLPAERVPALVDALDPVSVEQTIELQIAIPSYGDLSAKLILNSLNNYWPEKRAVLTSFLSMHRPSTVVPPLIAQYEKLSPAADEFRLRLTALRTLSNLSNKDTGNEPGVRAQLKSLANHLESPFSLKKGKEAMRLLSALRVSESMGLLNTVHDVTDGDRTTLLDSAPEDITSSIGKKGAEAFLKIVHQNRKESVARIQSELKVLDDAEPWVRKQLYSLVRSTNVGEILTAVTGLGEVSVPEDAGMIEPLLTHERAVVREAAAVALARLGEAGLPALTRAFSSSDTRTRSLVMASIPHSLTEKTWPLLQAGLKDPDPDVCLTAFSTIRDLPASLQSHRKEILAATRERLKTETDPNVRLALQLLK